MPFVAGTRGASLRSGRDSASGRYPPPVTATETRGTPAGTSWESPLPVVPRLVLASALMLFVELALIRWTGSNVVHLSYFSNFVLLGSFLGIGLGFLRAGRARYLPFYSPIALAALVLFVATYPVTVDRGQDDTVVYFTSLTTTGPPTWVVLPIVFLAAAVITAGPAELVGISRSCRGSPPTATT